MTAPERRPTAHQSHEQTQMARRPLHDLPDASHGGVPMTRDLAREALIRDVLRWADLNGFADGTDYIETTALEYEAAHTTTERMDS